MDQRVPFQEQSDLGAGHPVLEDEEVIALRREARADLEPAELGQDPVAFRGQMVAVLRAHQRLEIRDKSEPSEPLHDLVAPGLVAENVVDLMHGQVPVLGYPLHEIERLRGQSLPALLRFLQFRPRSDCRLLSCIFRPFRGSRLQVSSPPPSCCSPPPRPTTPGSSPLQPG